MTRICIALLACGMLSGHDAFAHARSESFSTWQIVDDTMTGVVTVSSGELTSLVILDNALPLERLFALHLAGTVSAASESGPCAASEPLPLTAASGFVRVEIVFDCGGDTVRSLHYRALFDRLPAHVHFARVYENGAFLAEALITDRADRWRRAEDESLSRHSFAAFLDLGMRHILSGPDHVAFLIGMLLVAGTFGRSLVSVTGFTLGHSVSLGAAVLGYLQADGRLVEAFIGFTVALLAVEYFLMRRPTAAGVAAVAGGAAWIVGAAALSLGVIATRAGAAYAGFGLFAFCYLLGSCRIPPEGGRAATVLFVATTAFGLIHGFGFAGFLMDTGITGASLAVPLLGFNLGVEIGQIAVLALAWLLARSLRDAERRRLAPPVAGALCAIGVFWFIGRSLAS